MASNNEPQENPANKEDFPEIIEFRAEQARRRRRVLGTVLIISGISILLGTTLVFVSMRSSSPTRFSFPAGLLLLVAGTIGGVRVLLSRFTNIDDRPIPYGEEGEKLEKKLLKGP
ncbi:MAG: hypothetical protein GY822_12250 [Deltaproteobacteria bacterium]|nr:hypothetical protein [Deltaproteobacteria bacterium]